MGIQKDKLGSPSTGSEDGGVDLAELVQELDHDEFDGPTVLNGKFRLQTDFCSALGHIVKHQLSTL